MPAHDTLDHAARALSRNSGLITPEEQATLGAAMILIAGCGSVGGSALEPLVRLGAMRFRLADPDVYELSNINRQVCTLADVGKTKGSVLARRASSINPYVQARVYDEGLTEENLDDALAGVSVVFDGIDPEESGWVKYLLHARSAQRGIPVVAGYDFGGKPTLYVFDYRRDRRPFFGKTTEDAHRDGRYRDAMRWLGYFHFPIDFLPIMRDGLRDGGVWPQVAYCVQGLGAITSRVIIDLLMAREVRRVVSVDLHRLTQPYPRAIRANARLPVEMLKTLWVANRYARRGRPTQGVTGDRVAPLKLSPTVAAALDGARLAPSRFNAQPWRFCVVGDDTIRMGWSSERWLAAADPQRRLATYALGSAIEAIDYLAEGTWGEPSAEQSQDAGWYGGELALGSLRESELLVRRAVLLARVTNRGKYLCDGLDPIVLAATQRVAASHGIELAVVDQRMLIERVAEVAAASMRQALEDDKPLDPLSRAAPSVRRAALAEIGAAGESRDRALLAQLCAVSALRRRAMKLGLAAALARRTCESTRNCAALLVLTSRGDSPLAWVRAGRALMGVWLILTEAGYAAQPQHAALESADGAARTREAARIDDSQTLLSVLRVGRGLSAPVRSPRLPLENLCDPRERPSR